MNVLETYDLIGEDGLVIHLEGVCDPQAALESELEPFFRSLEDFSGDWMPDVVQGKRQRRYSRPALWKALEERRDENVTELGLYRTKWPALDMSLTLHFPPLPPRLWIGVQVRPLSFFAQAERCRKFVDMVRVWTSRYPVEYTSAHSLADDQLSGAPEFGRDERTARKVGFDKIYELYWLNVFGAKLVESVGRERVLSTPAHRVEELPNGSVLLVTWPTAADFAGDEAREAQARAHVHLRPDLDLSTVRRNLRERTATLAPVEPRFHPDVAALLPRVVDRVGIHERQRRIAELNAWQPPEPEQWRPATAALPVDVDDAERVLSHYSLLAEHLVAMLHSDVPSVFKQTPESLTDIDFFLWLQDFPRTRERHVLDEYLVPAVGAYLGQVLVHHLRGRWLPRQNVQEAQVLVGSRVWLPMLRARDFLRSQQSLLDCSLTQLYRVAERHRF